MATNRLNLQIGGGDPDDYTRRRVERELAEQSNQVDDALDTFFEEMIVPALDGKAPPAVRRQIQEEVVYREPQSNVDLLSSYITESVKSEPKEFTNPRSLRENYSIEDRIALLEQDVFTKMSQATPNTLVSGIGASLDSGGGAVWLWDLEDVSIGTPNPQTSTYPAIANGAVLQFNNVTNQWYAGPASSDTVEVTTAQVDLTNPQSEDDLIPNQNDIVGYSALGTLTSQLDWNKKIYDYFTESLPLKGGTICANAATNTGAEDGTLRIQSTGGDTGKLILVNTQGNTSATLSAQLGNANFTSGVTAGVFVQTNATSTSAFTKANFSGLVQLNEDTTVASTKELIFERGNINTTIGGLVVKGITPSSAESANPAVSEILNVSYGNTTVGVANALNKGDAINYNGKVESVYNIANKQYVDSAVAAGAGVSFQFDGTCNVLLPLSDAANADVKQNAGYFYINEGAQGAANNTWVGIAGLVIATNQLIIWSATENRWFAGAIENDSAYLLRSAGVNQKITGSLYIDKSSGAGIIFQKSGVTNANLYVDGSANFTKVTSSGQIIGQTNIQATDYVRAGSYLQANTYLTVKANSNLNNDTDLESAVILKRSTKNTAAYNNFKILGNNCSDGDGNATDNMLKTYLYANDSNNRDFIAYYGSTSGNDRIQTRKSCDNRYPQLTASNSFTGTSNTFKEIVLQDTGTGGDSLSNYLLLCKTKSGTQTVEIMAEKGHILLKKAGSELQVVRGDTSGGDSTTGGINILGCQPGSTLTTKDLLRCKYYVSATGSSTQTGDAIEYFGRQDLGDCIMTRSNISMMITDAIDSNSAAETGAWATAYGVGGGSFDSSSYINYRIINNNTIQLIIRLSNGGVKILNNPFTFYPSGGFSTVLGNTVGGAFQLFTKAGVVLQATIGVVNNNNLQISAVTGGTQDVQGWAFLPYGKP